MERRTVHLGERNCVQKVRRCYYPSTINPRYIDFFSVLTITYTTDALPTFNDYHTDGPIHAQVEVGCNEGGQVGNNSPGAKSLWGRRITAGGAESLSNVTSTFSIQ